MLADAQNFARLDRNSQIREETERARAAGMAEESTEQKPRNCQKNERKRLFNIRNRKHYRVNKRRNRKNLIKDKSNKMYIRIKIK